MNDRTFVPPPHSSESSASSEALAPRQPWRAALMSLVLPGLGQLYNGEVNRAIWFFLVFALLSVPGLVMVALWLPTWATVPALALSLLASLGVWGLSVVQAWRRAGALADWRLRAWQFSGLYLLVLLVCDGVVLPQLILQVRATQVEAFRIPSDSMAPTLRRGDFLFADKRYNRPGAQAVQRGDIAIFVYPNDRTQYYVKRIVGLPGDRVEAGAQTLTVPPGQVFVLGDNATSSKDSRQFGTVPLPDVVGRVRQIWLSWGDGGVRWSRLGLTPQ